MAERVLVVDDEPGIRATLRRMLEEEGLEVAEAEDGGAALAALRSASPDVVLLDVILPDLDGFEICRQIKSDPELRLLPVILVTGLGHIEDRVKGIEAGADDFLSKPFERVELLARVRSLLKVKRFTDELERAEHVLLALAQAIEGRDPYTQGHCDRLSRYAGALGRRLGLDDDHVTALERAGVVHDIGKVSISDGVLKKPGPLSSDERNQMKRHPLIGEQICKPLKSFHLVLPIIRHHHERMDGSGYPDQLKGEAIPLTARILSVVDVFDALTTNRPYQTAFSQEEALEEMAKEVAKGWWDPQVFQAFRELIDEEGWNIPA
jgi:putative two-component system response regulator